jgi:hypothetical protein
MTLIGLLADYPLPELLFDLGARRRSGWLTLRNGEHDIEITLVEGGINAASSIDVRFRLGQRFRSSGQITDEQLGDILAAQCKDRGRTTGSLLVESGYVNEADVQRALASQASDLLFQILTQRGGCFSFQRGVIQPRHVAMDIPLERVVLSTISRADEWANEQLETGCIDIADKITPDMVESSIRDGWPVIEALLDGAETLDKVVSLAKIPRDQARAAIITLHGTGVVHILPS